MKGLIREGNSPGDPHRGRPFDTWVGIVGFLASTTAVLGSVAAIVWFVMGLKFETQGERILSDLERTKSELIENVKSELEEGIANQFSDIEVRFLSKDDVREEVKGLLVPLSKATSEAYSRTEELSSQVTQVRVFLEEELRPILRQNPGVFKSMPSPNGSTLTVWEQGFPGVGMTIPSTGAAPNYGVEQGMTVVVPYGTDLQQLEEFLDQFRN